MKRFFPSLILMSIFFLLAGRGLPLAVPENEELRELQNINQAWEYLENNLTDVKSLKTQQGWQLLDLPHTWNQWDATDYLPGYRRDASWYRKSLRLPKKKNKRFLLYFEGSNITTKVYVNEQLAGTHVGGYVGFEIDITPYIKRGKENEIAIRVDNSYNRDIIPSQKSDFFIYGGITRDVWLKTVSETHIQSTQISTPEVSKDRATTEIEVFLANPANKSLDAQIRCELIHPQSGEVISTQLEPVSLESGTTKASITLPEVKTPALWSPKNPFLYTLNISLEAEGEVLDKTIEKIGYRWYHFEPNGPFFLNGQRLLLRGTHRHEEHAGYGAAMPNVLHRKDIEMIKEMGANFLRLGHYPQDPEIYKACDELGVIVWDELPWCRGGKGGGTWEDNTKRLLREQIAQNYNHPSIFFWSLGNEIYWLPDFPGGDDIEELNTFVAELNEIAHEMDPYRLTTLRKYYEGAHLVDAFSPSIWSGWYAGVYKNYQQTIEQQRQKYPRFLHMEYGGSSHVGRHTENPIDGDGLVNKDDWAEEINQVNVKNIANSGDWTENYIVDLFDWHLSVSETTDWFAGNAQWAFKDFGTPLRPENAIPFINQKGLVDRAGKPKDAYYVFKSYWSEDLFAYIESHTWTERNGPEGKTRNCTVFSNCQSLELIHNGKSLGRKTRQIGQFPAAGLNWDVLFTEGENVLIAKGFMEENQVTADTLIINYSYDKHDSPHQIVLTSAALPNGHQLIEATMLDKKGKRVLDYEGRVYFSKDGAGELLINYGTPTRTQVIQMANGRACIELIPAEGTTTIEARNQDFKGSYLVLQVDKNKQVTVLATSPSSKQLNK